MIRVVNNLIPMLALTCLASTSFLPMALAQEFQTGDPISSVDESGERVFMSDNVKVYGSFHFSESCTSLLFM